MWADWTFLRLLGIGVTILSAAALFVSAARHRRTSGAYAIALLTLGVVVLVWGLALLSVRPRDQWVWLFAALPTIVIVNHAAILFILRAKVLPTSPQTDKRMDAMFGREAGFIKSAVPGLAGATERYFSISAIAIRYCIPAFLVAAIPIAVWNTLVPGLDGGSLAALARIPAAPITAAKYGLAGAYVFVLFFLGRRAMQSDITPGSVTWCAVTLGIGPIVAAVVGQLVYDGGVPPDKTQVAVFFMAGFSPKLAVEFLEGLARRTFGSPVVATVNGRAMPLSMVRGVTRAVEERLDEEAIHDVQGLALASPVRLLRNTSYDKRQILGWMDNALLIIALPEAWQAMERAGITGAIDLAWYAIDDEHHSGIRDRVRSLAQALKMEPRMLEDVIARLSEDSQVRLVWLLYQLDGEADPPWSQGGTA